MARIALQRQLVRGKHVFSSAAGFQQSKLQEPGALTFPVYNPATGEELGRVRDMGWKEAEEAVTQAYDAFQEWRNVTCKVCL